MRPVRISSPQTKLTKEGLNHMTSIPQVTVKSPHLLATKYHAVLLFRRWNDAKLVCRRYHISRASLYRWNKRFDGTKESLRDGSHRPLSQHPNAHSETEIKWIKDYHRRNPNISICFPPQKLVYAISLSPTPIKSSSHSSKGRPLG